MMTSSDEEYKNGGGGYGNKNDDDDRRISSNNSNGKSNSSINNNREQQQGGGVGRGIRESSDYSSGSGGVSSSRSVSSHTHNNNNKWAKYFTERCSTKFLLSSHGRWTLGILLILLVAVIWVAASEWIQYIFGELDFDKPFFLTYLNTSMFALWNLGFVFKKEWRDIPWKQVASAGEAFGEGVGGGSSAVDSSNSPSPSSLLRRSLARGDDPDAPKPPSTPMGTVADIRQNTDPDLRPQQPQHHRYPTTSTLTETEMKNVGSAGAADDGVRSSSSSISSVVDYEGRELIHQSNNNNNNATAATDGGSNDADVKIGTVGDDGNSIIYDDNDDDDDDESAVSVGPSAVTMYPRSHIFKIAALFCPLWFLANVLFNYSLSRTSVASNTILSSTSSIWALVLSRIAIPNSSISMMKGVALVISFGGAVMIALSDTASSGLGDGADAAAANATVMSNITTATTTTLSLSNMRRQLVAAVTASSSVIGNFGTDTTMTAAPSQSPTASPTAAGGSSGSSGSSSIGGDILALTSAFFYAAYTTVLRWGLPDERRYSMAMVFGYVGVINMVCMWVGFIILDWTGIEPFVFPSWSVWWPLIINGIIGTNLSDILWAKSVILTSPFVATLGLSLTTPMAMVADFVLKGAHFAAMYILGAIAVTAGFVVANL